MTLDNKTHGKPIIPEKIQQHHLIHNIKLKKHKSHIAHFRIFFEMLLKHFKLLLKSNVTLLTIIIGPLIMVLLIGFAFNTTGNAQITVATFSEAHNNLSLSLMAGLDDSFNLEKATSLKNCKDLIISGNANICLVFPPNLNPENMSSDNELVIYADFTQINLVHSMLDILNKKVSLENDDLRLNYVSALMDTIKSSRIKSQTNDLYLNKSFFQIQTLSDLLDNSNSLLDSLDLSSTQSSPVGKNFSDNINNLDTQVKKLALSLNSYKLLQSKILSNKNDFVQDYEVAYEKYTNDCLGNTTAYDCDEQKVKLDYLADVKDLLINYNSLSSENNNVTAMIINLSVNLNGLKKTALSLNQDLSILNTKLTQADSVTQETLNNIINSESSLSSINEYSTKLEQSNDELVNAIDQLSLTDTKKIVNPLQTRIEELSVGNEKNIMKLFPDLLVLFIMLMGLVLSSTFIILEKKSSAFIRNNIAPVRKIFLPLSSALVLISILVVESLVVVILSHYLFALHLLGQFGNLLLAIFLSVMFFVLFGMTLGFFFDDVESIALSSSLIGTLMLLFSSLIFPIEKMSLFFARIASFNPFVIVSKLFKKIIIFSGNFATYLPELLILLIALAIIIVLLIVAFEVSIRKS